MKTLYLLCGMPFSGKTTLAKAVLKYLDSAYISLDEINESRGLFGGMGISVEEWETTHAIARSRLKDIMPSQQDIVLDDTSCLRWLRDRWRSLGQQHGYQTVIIYLNVPIAEIKRRIAENETIKARQEIRQEIVDEMVTSFEPPQADEIAISYSPSQNPKGFIKYLADSID